MNLGLSASAGGASRATARIALRFMAGSFPWRGRSTAYAAPRAPDSGLGLLRLGLAARRHPRERERCVGLGRDAQVRGQGLRLPRREEYVQLLGLLVRFDFVVERQVAHAAGRRNEVRIQAADAAQRADLPALDQPA